MDDLSTKIKGNITELETAVALVRRKCGVCIPYGDRNRYDIVADVDGKLLKLQCKTSHTSDGGKTFGFKTCSVHYANGERISVGYSPGEVDYFATVFNNKCYLVPPPSGGVPSSITLRLKQPENNQTSGINWAKKYEIGTVLSKVRGKMMRECHQVDKVDNDLPIDDDRQSTGFVCNFS